jgi:hypothetical protein
LHCLPFRAQATGVGAREDEAAPGRIPSGLCLGILDEPQGSASHVADDDRVETDGAMSRCGGGRCAQEIG